MFICVFRTRFPLGNGYQTREVGTGAHLNGQVEVETFNLAGSDTLTVGHYPTVKVSEDFLPYLYEEVGKVKAALNAAMSQKNFWRVLQELAKLEGKLDTMAKDMGLVARVRKPWWRKLLTRLFGK